MNKLWTAAASMMSASTQRSGPGHKQNTVKYENTYKMEPDAKFPAYKVREIIKEVLEDKMEGFKYDAAKCSKHSKLVADEIKRRVKLIGVQRFKFVTMVIIGQIETSPSINIASQFVWNDKYDTYAQEAYKNDSVYAVGICYCLYCE